MANNNWIALSGDIWSSAHSWSLGTVPTYADDVVFASGFSNFGCTVTIGGQCKSLTTSGSYGGALSWNGQTMTISGNCTIAGSGSFNPGNGTTLIAPSGIFTYETTMGTISSNSHTLTFNSTNHQLIINKANLIYAASLVLANNASCVISGTATTVQLRYGSTKITLGTNATLTHNIQNMTLSMPSNGDKPWSTGAGSVINGSGNLNIRSENAITNITLSAITYSGTGTISIRDAATLGFNVTTNGNLNFGSAPFEFTATTNSTMRWTTNNFNLTCGTFQFGTSSTGTCSGDFGSSVISMSSFSSLNNASATNILNLQSSQITCSGNLTFGANWNLNPGTSLITIANTSTVTSNTKSVYDFNVNTAASGTMITFADSPRISGDFTVTLGSTNLDGLNWSGWGDVLFDGLGSHVVGSGITMMGPGTIRFGNSAPNFNTQGLFLTCNDDTTLTIGIKTIRRLKLASGKTYTWTAGIGPITTASAVYVSGDWDGATIKSSSAGTRFGLAAPSGTIVYNMNVKDCDNSTGVQVNASDISNVDGGNNLNWLFYTAPTPSTTTTLTEMRFYNPLLHKQYIKKNINTLKAVRRYIGGMQ